MIVIHKFWGKVRKAIQRGRKLGFPTANINLAKKIPEGIYISKTKIQNEQYHALTFIGKAKTFNEKKFHAEVYILDFKQNIYGKWLSVKLLKRIRSNRKFNSAQGLIAQMKKDEIVARKYYNKFGGEDK